MSTDTKTLQASPKKASSTTASAAGSTTIIFDSKETFTQKYMKGLNYVNNLFIKYRSLNRTVMIGTHDGLCHADELFAIAVLQHALKHSGLKSYVTRSRNKDVWATMDILVDVGGVYDPSICRFDHHQPAFQDKWDRLIMSSAGLVWRHFGMYCVAAAFHDARSEMDLEKVYTTVYRKIVRPIDAADNAVSPHDPAVMQAALYEQEGVTISSLVALFAPTTAECEEEGISMSDAQDQAFEEMLPMLAKLLDKKLKNAISSQRSSWDLRKQLDASAKIDPTGRVVVLGSYMKPKDIIEIEEGWRSPKDASPKLLMAVSMNMTAKPPNWSVHALPVSLYDPTLRILPPQHWLGASVSDVTEEAKAKVKRVNIPGFVFCHKSGFVCANETKEGAVGMATYMLSVHDVNCALEKATAAEPPETIWVMAAFDKPSFSASMEV